jgi:8-oxo-dGTP pyrophosphatase MutT (NUDIX family)
VSEPIEKEKKTPVTPVGASTVLLLRDGVAHGGAAGLEVFMVVRHHEIDFASGALVFPGGKVDPGDGDPALAGRCGGVLAVGREFRVAAIRETFEEAGIFLARPRGAADLLDPDRHGRIVEKYHAALDAGDIVIRDVVEAEDLDLACDLLVPFAHWITPEWQRRRFDTHFFAARTPEKLLARHDGTESVDSVWITPADALADAEAERRTVVFPTRMNLGKLGRSATVEAALAAARATPVVTVLPQVEMVEGGRFIRIPAEAGYGVTGELVRYASS